MKTMGIQSHIRETQVLPRGESRERDDRLGAGTPRKRVDLYLFMCWAGSGACAGINIFGDQISGMIIGLAAGLTLGATMDAQDRAARKRENPPKKINTTSEKPQG
jgi:hypothetical protein